MTDEAKRCVEVLRNIVANKLHTSHVFMYNNMLNAAGLIESLSAELEQVRRERDGLNVMLGQAQSMLETRTRERDAAVKDLKECSYFPCMTCSKRNGKNECEVFGKRPESLDSVTFCGMYEWRGVQEDDRK